VGAGPQQLTVGQEHQLLIGAKAGRADARQRLVASFLPGIIGVAARFPRGGGVEPEELIQAGVVGVLFAARRYNLSLRTPFWAYASFWVRKAMQELIAERTRAVALSDRAVRELARIRTARNEHLRLHGIEPSDRELSCATGFSRAQVESLRAAERMPSGVDERVHDIVADPVAEQEYDRVLDVIEIGELHRHAGDLDERERSVLYAHYGLGQPAQTLNEIGSTLGLTGERARQIEACALTKLREALTSTS
jgi:RNA polymerase primary sigma factor